MTEEELPNEPPLPRKRRSMLQGLSPREKDVLSGIVRGLTNKQVAVQLGISHRTVEVHRARLMHKLSARNFAELMTIVLAAKGARA